MRVVPHARHGDGQARERLAYVSTMVRLNPGDIIATGTPGGVGHARKPERYLVGGETVVAEIDGIGRLVNLVVKGRVA